METIPPDVILDEWKDLCVSKKLKCKLSRPLVHALAELKANAGDASRDQGLPIEYTYDISSNCVVLVNHGVKLEPDHFIIGNSESRDDHCKAGIHGIGLKDALAISYNHNCTMMIESHGDKFEFVLKCARGYTVETIHMRHTRPPALSNGPRVTRITIKGPPDGNLLAWAFRQTSHAEAEAEPIQRNGSSTSPASASAISSSPPRLASNVIRNAKSTPPPPPTPPRRLFSPTADSQAGQLKLLKVVRKVGGPLYFDWDLTSKKKNAERKLWFSQTQKVEPSYEASLEGLMRNELKLANTHLPADAYGTLEYCLLASLAELRAFHLAHAANAGIAHAIEVLSRGMDEHHRRTRYLVTEVQDVLQAELGIAEFYPSGSYAKATQLPLHSDLDLIMVFNHAGASLKQATAEQVASVQRCLEAAFPTRLGSPKVTAFSFQCLLDGVEVDILPVSSRIWRATAERRTSAAPGDEPYYSAAMAETQVDKFKARAQALERKELNVRPVIRLLKAWLQGHAPWEAGTKPRSCLIEELVLKAAESRALVPSQEALVKDVLALLSEFLPRPIVDDPIYKANNLAAGLDPATVIGYAKVALAAWPTAFLGKLAM